MEKEMLNSAAPSVLAVIPNYNGLKFMETCMAALERQSYDNFSVLVVDNGSSDGSVEYLEELKRSRASGGEGAYGFGFDILPLPENTGFSGAVNRGIEAGIRDGFKYIILLNNDTEAEPGYIEALVAAMEKDERVFSASPLMIQYHNRRLIDDAGDGYCLLGWGFQLGVGHRTDEAVYGRGREVFSACAGAAIYRSEILDRIKISPGEYFDLQHFAYLEDIDIGYRARLAGYRNIYCPESRIYHVGSGTSGSKYNPFKVRLAARNNIFLNYKNMPLPQLIINLPFLLAGTAVKAAFFRKKGFLKDYAGGLAEGVKGLGKCRRPRLGAAAFPRCVYIEWLLIKNTFIYISEFLKRKSG